jgi:hypothetical protein
MNEKINFSIYECVFILAFSQMMDVHGSTSFIPGVDGYIGQYSKTRYIDEVVKVYITYDSIDIIESTNTDVITEVITKKTCLFFNLFCSTHTETKYYYETTMRVNKVIEERHLFNDVDSLIYMLKELEYRASNYDSCKGQNMNNCVIGYIRGINEGYVTGYGGLFTSALGNVNVGFVNYVNQQTGDNGLQVYEYFAAFESTTTFNSQLYGEVESFNHGNAVKLIDPLNDISTTEGSIDLIHLFASIDGIYEDTEALLDPFDNIVVSIDHMISWAGDLQKYTVELENQGVTREEIDHVIDSWSDTRNYEYDFCDLLGSTCEFSNEDMLSDIDAMNIAELLINGIPEYDTYCDYNGFCTTYTIYDDLNLVSTAFAGYYNIVGYDNSSALPNRYKIFLDSIFFENGRKSNENDLNDFRELVNEYTAIKHENGIYVDDWPLLSSKSTFLYNNGEKVNILYRELSSKLFKEYIINMSTKAIYSSGGGVGYYNPTSPYIIKEFLAL